MIYDMRSQESSGRRLDSLERNKELKMKKRNQKKPSGTNAKKPDLKIKKEVVKDLDPQNLQEIKGGLRGCIGTCENCTVTCRYPVSG